MVVVVVVVSVGVVLVLVVVFLAFVVHLHRCLLFFSQVLMCLLVCIPLFVFVF